MHRILRHTLVLALVAGGLAGLASGCATKPDPTNTISPQATIGRAAIIPDKRLMCDPNIHNVIDVGDVNEDTTPEGLLKIQVHLTNLTTHFQSVEYRFDWTDDHGILFASPTSRYMLVKLRPKDSILVVGIAPHPAIKDFVFKVNPRN